MEFKFINNESAFKFYSFVYQNQALSYSLFDFLIKKYNKYEYDLLFQINHTHNKNVFTLDKNEFEIVLKNAEQNKINKFSKSDKNFSFNSKIEFNNLVEELNYIIKKSNDSFIEFDEDKFKKFIKYNIANVSLETPEDLSDNLNINLKNQMYRVIKNINNDSSGEKAFLTFMCKNEFSFNDITGEFYKNLKKYISKENKQLQNISEDLINFSKLVLDNFKIFLNELPHITEALECKTKRILLFVSENDCLSTKQKIINSYLDKSMKTIKNFYSSKSKHTIKGYLEMINRYFTLLHDSHESYKYDNLFNEWKLLYSNFSQELENLNMNINKIIIELKSKEKLLEFEEKTNNIFENFVENKNYESENNISNKKINFKEWVGLNEFNCINYSITNTSLLRVERIIKNDSEKKDIFNNDDLIDEVIKLIEYEEQPSITKEELEKIKLESEEFEINHKKEIELKELEKQEYDKNLKDAIKILKETIINRSSSKDIVNQLKVNYRSETYQKFLKETFKNYDENDREFFKIKEEIFKTIRIGA